jgi:hypothetical protein
MLYLMQPISPDSGLDCCSVVGQLDKLHKLYTLMLRCQAKTQEMSSAFCRKDAEKIQMPLISKVTPKSLYLVAEQWITDLLPGNPNS